MQDKTVFEERKVSCPVCGGNLKERYVPFIGRWVADKCECVKSKERLESIEREKTRRILKIEEYKRESGIEPRYRNASFENFITDSKTKKAHRSAKVYSEKFTEIEKNGTGLIFTGNTGSGKTHLACAIANSLLEKCVRVRFITYSELMRRINGANDYGATENAIIADLQRCRLLIIDDIAALNASEKGKTVMFTILDKRINNYRPTIFTSNVTNLDELKTRFNEQIYDRIKGNCYKIDILCDSHRKL